MQSIMEVIDLMVEYNPGLLMIQVGKQLDKVKGRVTVLVNEVQQLYHRQQAIDLPTLEQVGIIHQAGQEKYTMQGLMHKQLKSQAPIRWKPHMSVTMTMVSSFFCVYLAPKKLIH
jgi:hypothetical protein